MLDSLAKYHGQGEFDFRQRKTLSNAVPVRGSDKYRKSKYSLFSYVKLTTP